LFQPFLGCQGSRGITLTDRRRGLTAPFLFMRKNDYLCMFKYSDNDKGYIQCTIANEFIADFESLGFVDNINAIVKPKKQTKKQKKQHSLLGGQDDRNSG